MNNIEDTVDQLMLPYKAVLDRDYEKYRNHVCRVVGNCMLLDKNPAHFMKYAIAGVFHDIGIWTNNTIDYLAPSIVVARKYLVQENLQEMAEEIELMIYWHHKTTSYKGDFQDTVNNFRKADWIDVSLGVLAFGADRNTAGAYRKQFPNSGFHLFLLRKIFKNLVRHPLNPLPMFKH
ncbi:hypothetical protein [Flavitalea sp.]|nr:hypothetical protein [Flavitalea sp.]